ncbi:small nuclear RNA activating complex polypeptide 1 [Rhinolophus ferrumequinum]|uniref:Small nuclear RNA activating complex polypeptide 1 n=1 Tax=Rhinolophus ferrumequinum TaxID=59479 RepID=A0A671DV72_RHIFE|nr:snRNA-activating protein complex subunit 1 [Rhinolophus ferrumequinum]KAF6352469.1 small nuclear RNA activating complex polypeptide 1 [Rhinolophus ferrumequinum]
MGTPPGLQADCEALLSRFQEKDSVRFEDFTEVWRSMKFGTIFCGRMRNLEKNTFTKEALALAWRYFLPPYTFQIRVGALYLLYGLYNTQLCQPKQKIRVALKDWDEVLKFQQDLINAQHFDAAYIFRKLRLDKAFHFTAMPKLLSYRMKKKIQRAEVTEEFKDPNDRVMKLITSDVLEEMLNVHDHYQNMKHIISVDKSNPDKALSLIKDDFFDNIKNIVLEHQQWHKDRKNPSLKSKVKDGEEKREGNSQESERCERAESLAKIKSKAFSVVVQASKSRRHRQVRLDSSDSDSASGQGQITATRKKGNKEMLKSAGKKMSSRKRDDTQNIHKEDKCLSLSMPVITEEDEENKSYSETEFTAPKRKRKHRTKSLV